MVSNMYFFLKMQAGFDAKRRCLWHTTPTEGAAAMPPVGEDLDMNNADEMMNEEEEVNHNQPSQPSLEPAVNAYPGSQNTQIHPSLATYVHPNLHQPVHCSQVSRLM